MRYNRREHTIGKLARTRKYTPHQCLGPPGRRMVLTRGIQSTGYRPRRDCILKSYRRAYKGVYVIGLHNSTETKAAKPPALTSMQSIGLSLRFPVKIPQSRSELASRQTSRSDLFPPLPSTREGHNTCICKACFVFAGNIERILTSYWPGL